MKRLGGSLVIALIAALSLSTALYAQRGGGRGGGGRGGGRGGDGNGRGGSFFGAFGPQTRPQPTNGTQGLSVDHPLPGNLNTVRPAPVLGFGPPPPAPFAARPGTYTRQRRAGSYGSSLGT